MPIPRILVVDDDQEMRDMMVAYLQKQGTVALGAETEEDIRAALATGRLDLILLDVMLGRQNGVEICRRLRKELDLPIIIVSALSADQHRMAGYRGGADDYIAKPFNPDLLIARIRAVMRRLRRSPSLAYRRSAGTWTFSGWTFDAKGDEIQSPDGYHVTLSQRETRLLKLLLANPHVPLTREEIAAGLDVTGEETADPGGRAIDMLVGRLRSKIEADPRKPRLLRTERNVGYVFGADVVLQE
ncbi:response regulator transcription factor [Mangrovicoccus sp. HB161399]|uniref:response regulator transcription factor n=1 Tax=Mangrovicoccus sp. HB161399 TaxID=2720392 RepID=UPI001551A14F|nr:response regulator transcription factor [Mangrovicoccus sp. HB161399]